MQKNGGRVECGEPQRLGALSELIDGLSATPVLLHITDKDRSR